MWMMLAFIPERFKRIGFWSRDSLLPPEPILAVAAILLLAAGSWWLWKAGLRLWRKSDGLRLFNRIAAERELSAWQRWELWRLSRREGLATPVTLLVCEATLAAHVGRAAARLAPEAAQGLQHDMALVRRRLFHS